MTILFEQLGSIAGAAFHKEAEDLTEAEKIALAVMSGCAYRTTWQEDGKLRIDIIDPIGFQKIDGKLIVCQGVARQGDRLTLQPGESQ